MSTKRICGLLFLLVCWAAPRVALAGGSCPRAGLACANDATCNDGLYCNGQETCNLATSQCVCGPRPCDDGLSCTVVDNCFENTDTCQNIPEDSICDLDGDPCDGVEYCNTGANPKTNPSGCDTAPAPNCFDGVDCTSDDCTFMFGCLNLPDDLYCQNAPQDGNFCNGLEYCDPVDGCQAAKSPACVVATAPICNEMSDTCGPCTTDEECRGGDFCSRRVCNTNTGACEDGPDNRCADPFDCTVDVCHPETLECMQNRDFASCCTNTPNNDACADDTFCNGDEICDPFCVTAACVAGGQVAGLLPGCVFGPPRACNDGDPCNGIETCDEDANSCAPGTPPCDNGDACDGQETCTPVCRCCVEDSGDCVASSFPPICTTAPYIRAECTASCTPGTPMVCDDGRTCTDDCCFDDVCHFVVGPQGACQDVTAGPAAADMCDNGMFCDGLEHCNTGPPDPNENPDSGCVPGTPPECTDPLFCSESCDRCIRCNGSEDCDDGLVCNGLEQCVIDGVAGDICGDLCTPGLPPPCFDILFCNGEESCTEGTCPKTVLCCSQNNSCTEDVPFDECLGSGVPFCGGCDSYLCCTDSSCVPTNSTSDCFDGGGQPICDDCEDIRCCFEAATAGMIIIGGGPFSCPGVSSIEACTTAGGTPFCADCGVGECCFPDNVAGSSDEECIDNLPPPLLARCNLLLDSRVDCGAGCQPGEEPCDDGLICNGQESCFETPFCECCIGPAGCVPVPPGGCGPFLVCHNEGCNPGTPPECDNGVFCDGEETCSEGHCPNELLCCSGGGLCVEGVPADECGAHRREFGFCGGCDEYLCCATGDGCEEDVEPSLCLMGEGIPVCADCQDIRCCTFDTIAGGIIILPFDLNCVPTDSAVECAESNGFPLCADCGFGRCCEETAVAGNPRECTDELPPPFLARCPNLFKGNGVIDCGQGCQPGEPECDDDVPCSRDICFEDEDRCENTPINEFCDDGVECTEDLCLLEPVTAGNGNGFHPGCVHNPQDEVCDDGQFCNGEETCVARECPDSVLCCGKGCQDNVPLDACLDFEGIVLCGGCENYLCCDSLGGGCSDEPVDPSTCGGIPFCAECESLVCCAPPTVAGPGVPFCQPVDSLAQCENVGGIPICTDCGTVRCCGGGSVAGDPNGDGCIDLPVTLCRLVGGTPDCGGCEPGTPPECPSDNNECTNDFCDPQANACVNQEIEDCVPPNTRRVSMDQKGSLIMFSKVELKWSNTGQLLQDTFIDLSNDYPGTVDFQAYFINGDKPLPEIRNPLPPFNIIQRFEPGWNTADCRFRLTANQPMYWSAAFGGECQAFTVLDAVGPGRPDPETGGATRILRGMMVLWAIDFNLDTNRWEEIRWNHLKGDAVIVNYQDGTAWEYNAWAFQAYEVAHGQFTGTPGELHMNGLEYDMPYADLLLDFYGAGSMVLSQGPIMAQVDTDITLHPVSQDLRQDGDGPVVTKAEFLVTNEYESTRSGTRRCIACWDQTLASNYEEPPLVINLLDVDFLGSDKGKARISGVGSQECDNLPPFFKRSENAALLGVAAKIIQFSGASDKKSKAGMSMVGFGTEEALILYDLEDGPQGLQELDPTMHSPMGPAGSPSKLPISQDGSIDRESADERDDEIPDE